MEPLPTPDELHEIASDPLESAVIGAATNDPRAWQALMLALEPLVAKLARRRGQFDADDRAEVYLRVLDRLRANDSRALSRYLATRDRYPELGFANYLSAIVSSAVIDHVRAKPENLRTRQASARRLVSVQLRPLESVAEPAAATDVSEAVEIRRILSKLTDARFPADQRRALLLWLYGHDASAIADELGLASATEAKRLLRAARERLRRAVRKRR